MTTNNPVKPKIRLRISGIIDKLTVSLIGQGVSELKEGDPLSIITVSRSPVYGTSAPLVLEKEKIKVSSVTNYYAVAKASEIIDDDEQYISLKPLNINENDMRGNP